MKQKLFFFFFLLLPLSLSAQHRGRTARVSHHVDTMAVVKRYVDSLKWHRDSIDALYSYDHEVKPKKQYYRLFAPITFYNNIPHEVFDINQADSLSDVDRQLLFIYLNRPDLVQTTEAQLDVVGAPVANSSDKPVTRTPIVMQEAPAGPGNDVVDGPDVNLTIVRPNFWKYRGDYYLQFLQNYISDNWYKGGESNYSMVASATMEANYNNKQKVRWDNKLEAKLGFQTVKSDTVHKFRASENLLRFTSKLGLQASRRWYYTLQMVANTQITRIWDKNSNYVTTDFMDPFNLNVSLGMDYNAEWLQKRITGSIHLAPLAYNLKYVGRAHLATRYGIEAGKVSLNDYGSQMTIDMRWKMSNNINWRTRMYAYTTYKRTEFEWENTFSFQFNKYISTNLFIYPRFDDGGRKDDDHGYWMLKEYFSLGFNYSF